MAGNVLKSFALKVVKSEDKLTKLVVKVKNAGSKDGKSGISHLLSKFNFLACETRSGLRIVRESEIMGGQLKSFVRRDHLEFRAEFLKEYLPFYINIIGDVLKERKFNEHVYRENVLPFAKNEYDTMMKLNLFCGLEALHEISFKNGLGKPLYYDGTQEILLDDIKVFADEKYVLPNIEIFASGAVKNDLQRFIVESPFSLLCDNAQEEIGEVFLTKKEKRIRRSGPSLCIVGAPVTVENFGAYELLVSLIKKSKINENVLSLNDRNFMGCGLNKYRNAGLFYLYTQGSPGFASLKMKNILTYIKSLSNSDLLSFVNDAKLSLLMQSSFDCPLNFEITNSIPAQLNLNMISIGDTDQLPYLNDLL